MQYTKKLKSHGVDQKDFKIIKEILDVPKGSTEISNNIQISRPTVLFRLNKMLERGLVVKSGKRPAVKWSVSKTCVDILSGNGECQVENKTKGIKNIEARLKRLIRESRNKRVYFIKNLNYFKNADKKFSEEYKKFACKMLVREKVVLEGISSLSASICYKQTNEAKDPKSLRKMISWTVLDDEYIGKKDSFFVLEEKVFIVNLEQEYLKEIESSTLSRMIVAHIKSLSRFGRKIDLTRLAEKECVRA